MAANCSTVASYNREAWNPPPERRPTATLARWTRSPPPAHQPPRTRSRLSAAPWTPRRSSATRIDARTPAWDLLDLLRRPVVLRRIDAAGTVPAWTERIVALVDRSHLTMGQLFRRRAEEYGGKTLFEIPGPGPARSVSWRQASARVDALARGLLRIAGESG